MENDVGLIELCLTQATKQKRMSCDSNCDITYHVVYVKENNSAKGMSVFMAGLWGAVPCVGRHKHTSAQGILQEPTLTAS